MLGRSLVGRDLSGIEERARAIRGGLALVAGLEDPVRRQEYARVLSGMVGEPEVSVMLELEQMVAAQGRGATGLERHPRARLPAAQKVEREALKVLLQIPELCTSWFAELRADQFATPTYRVAFELIQESGAAASASGSGGGAATAGPSALVAMAHERPRGDQLAKLIAALAVEPPETVGEPTGSYADQVFFRLQEFDLKRRVDEIRIQLQRINPQKEQEKYDLLWEQFIRLEGDRRRIRDASEAVGSSL
jgi:DNA primase